MTVTQVDRADKQLSTAVGFLGPAGQPGCPSRSPALSSFPSFLLPRSIKLPGTDALTKIFLILSFLIVSMQLMELYLQHFSFRIHNFKKPYNITSFNRKEKALIKRRTLRKHCRPYLIAENRQTEVNKETSHQRNARVCSLAYYTSLLQRKGESASPPPTPTSQLRFSVCARFHLKFHSLRTGTKTLRVILPSQHPFNVKTESKQAKKKSFFKEKKISLI